jgi:Tfp pilus assembly protein PilX
MQRPLDESSIHTVGGHADRAIAAKAARSRGVALVTTLILLALLGALSVAISLLVSSDSMINGYYRNYRGSFYAADSGATVVIESMKNAMYNAANEAATYPNGPLPMDGQALPTNAFGVVQMNASDGYGATAAFPANFNNSFTPFESKTYTVGDTGSWQGTFQVVSVTLGNPSFTVGNYQIDNASCWPPTQATCGTAPNTVTNDQDLQWTFRYPYSITVQGSSSGGGTEQITQTGMIVYQSAPGGAGNTGTSFSKWGAYITDYSACQGALVPGTMSGPFFTDGQWNFGNFTSPSYTFNGSVGQVGTQVSYINGASCTNKTWPSTPTGFKVPTFNGGFHPGQALVQPPTDTYNQAQAVLDGKGTSCGTTCQNSMMAAELQTVTGGSYNPSSPATGVYIPMYNNGGVKTFGCQPPSPPTTSTCSGAGGGFYVQGNASIKLSATTTGGDATETYTITQSSTTTTIVVDNTAGTTTVTQNSGSPVVLQGVPSQVGSSANIDPNGSTVDPTMLYVNGTITGLTGPTSGGSAQPAIQNDVGVTVVSSQNITISGDLEYESNSMPVNASDVLNTSSNAGVLGIYTTGNINLKPDSSGNLTVDASLAALSGTTDGTGNSGFCTATSVTSCDANGSSINQWTILGGRAEDHAHSVNISQGNTLYDQRFSSGSFGPPWFPTSIPGASTPPITAYQMVQVQRGSWAETRP